MARHHAASSCKAPSKVLGYSRVPTHLARAELLGRERQPLGVDRRLVRRLDVDLFAPPMGYSDGWMEWNGMGKADAGAGVTAATRACTATRVVLAVAVVGRDDRPRPTDH